MQIITRVKSLGCTGEITGLRRSNQGMKWQELRYGVADLYRRAEVSHRANARYLEALASVTGRTPLHQEALGVCQALIVEHHRYRALNPWSLADGKSATPCRKCFLF